jgi:hypothetical protein
VFKEIARDAAGLQGVDIAPAFSLEDTQGPAGFVVFPAGGEDLPGGTPVDLEWTLSDCSGTDSTAIRVSFDNGSAWTLLATVPSPDTSWSWAVPDTSADSCLVEITLSDVHGNTTVDVSASFSITGSALSVGDGAAPGVPLLARVYPNPMRSSARIAFSVPAETPVAVRIYDLQGRVVRTLVDDTVGSGYHEHTWDGTGDDGRRAAAGIYFTVLDTPDLRQTRKIVLAR